MKQKNLNGDFLSREQETSALISQCFRNLKLYKMRLVHAQPTLFGDYSFSHQWELLAKAMKGDLYKEKEFCFRHPKDSEKKYERHYISSPLNGNAFLVVGQFKKDLDFAFVRILLHSVFYGEPYLVFEKYAQSFRNPDILAKMVESAFNWVLKGSGMEMKLEPWEPEENIMWLLDYEVSYMNEMHKMKKEDLIMIGYEEALELHRELEAMKGESRKPKVSKKSDDILTYILADNKEAVAWFLHEALKGQKTPKGIARPFRFLFDHKLSDHIPYKAVMKEFPELEGLIKERSYNNWTNPNSTSYDRDPQYQKMEETFKLFR